MNADRAAHWMYQGIWRGLVRWFRVPGEPPTLPAREVDRPESFKPSPSFLSYLKLWFWIVCVIIDFGLLAGYLAVSAALCMEGLWWISLLLLPVFLGMAIVPDVMAYFAVHLRYDTTWYVMTDRSLRIRRGIWIIQETTITFENVQNVKVSQGPVQRHFGISNLVVETAGAGASSQKGHQLITNQGVIEGVQDAARLRDRILARMKASRSAGLGDEDDERIAVPVPSRWADAHLAVLREIRNLVKNAA